MHVCECMATQQEDGSSRCNQCRGDIYACECPLVHKLTCPYNPENNKEGVRGPMYEQPLQPWHITEEMKEEGEYWLPIAREQLAKEKHEHSNCRKD